MPSLRIAAAQSRSAPGDVAANVVTHCRFIDEAAAAGVGLLVFPELSLSGYEPDLVASCCLEPEDHELAPLRERAERAAMALVVGAPLRSGAARPYIGAITFFPDGSAATYRKRHLHPSEEPFASPGGPGGNVYPLSAEESFALAICADVTHAAHGAAAATAGTSLYVASSLLSERGYGADAAILRGYAERHGYGVLLANHAAPSGPYVSAGRSAFWAPGGELVIAADGPGSYLVVAARRAAGWSGDVREVTA